MSAPPKIKERLASDFSKKAAPEWGKRVKVEQFAVDSEFTGFLKRVLKMFAKKTVT